MLIRQETPQGSTWQGFQPGESTKGVEVQTARKIRISFVERKQLCSFRFWGPLTKTTKTHGPPPTLTPPLRGKGWIRMSFLSSTSPGLNKGLIRAHQEIFFKVRIMTGYGMDFGKVLTKKNRFLNKTLLRKREQIRPKSIRLIKVLIKVYPKKASAVYYLRCPFLWKVLIAL